MIQRSKVGLDNTPWSELLQPHVAGALSSPEVEADIQSTITQLSFNLGDNNQVIINHGFVYNPETKETNYLIDNDFFTNNVKSEATHVTTILNTFNKQSRNIFRWAIAEKLYNAMGPDTF